MFRLATTWILLLALLAPGLAQAQQQTDELAKRLADVEDRLDQVEKSTLLDRVQLSGDYRVMLNTFHYEGVSPSMFDRPDPVFAPFTRRQISATAEEVWSHRFRLTLKAEPVRSLRFTARMVMFKHFGDQDSPMMVFDFASTRTPRDSGVRFDQLWIDWFITDWLALSAGRIAYAEGNPAELRENSSIRRATWGMHMVDGEYETLNLTLNLGAVSNALKGFYGRLFYASWYFDNDDAMGQFPFLESQENLRIIGGNFDAKIPGLGNNFLQLGYYIVPKFKPFPIPVPDVTSWDQSQDPQHLPQMMNGSLLFPANNPDTLGTYQNISALVEFYNIAGLGLDFFAAGAVGLFNPKECDNNTDCTLAYKFVTPDPADPFNPATNARRVTPFLALSSKGDDGVAFLAYTGARYTLPLKTWRPKLGLEFNYGSRYWISFNQPNDQLLAKLATRGKAYEAYAIFPLNKRMYIRASYILIDNDYQQGFFGPDPQFIENFSASVAAAKIQRDQGITPNMGDPAFLAAFGQAMASPEIQDAIKTSTSQPFKQTIHNFQLMLNVSL